jgi:hypothetical protein
MDGGPIELVSVTESPWHKFVLPPAVIIGAAGTLQTTMVVMALSMQPVEVSVTTTV